MQVDPPPPAYTPRAPSELHEEPRLTKTPRYPQVSECYQLDDLSATHGNPLPREDDTVQDSEQALANVALEPTANANRKNERTCGTCEWIAFIFWLVSLAMVITSGVLGRRELKRRCKEVVQGEVKYCKFGVAKVLFGIGLPLVLFGFCICTSRRGKDQPPSKHTCGRVLFGMALCLWGATVFVLGLYLCPAEGDCLDYGYGYSGNSKATIVTQTFVYTYPTDGDWGQ